MNGFYRIAAATPESRVGDPKFNAARIIELADEARRNGAAVVVFPELCVSGYSCGDMFADQSLLAASDEAVARIAQSTAGSDAVLVCGAPLRRMSRLFNAALVISNGEIRGAALKEYLPNYREFYEKRQFRSVRDFFAGSIAFDNAASVEKGASKSAMPCDVPAGAGLVFDDGNGFSFGVEICEDLWAIVPPSSDLALGGAHAIFNLSASPELVAKASFRRDLVANQSARISGIYALAGAGVGESASGEVYSGHSLIAFNGHVLAESERFSRKGSVIYADFKPAWADTTRANWTSFNDAAPRAPIRAVRIPALPESPDLRCLEIAPHPFVPSTPGTRADRCREVFSIQTAGLAKRIETSRAKTLVAGISGGLDSTLALLAASSACDLLGFPRAAVIAVTMPGFGTTSRTKTNAEKLAELLGAELRSIPIGKAVLQHFEDIGHDPAKLDIVYENAQARERTQILFDIANAENGILVGTGDLSEIALGWSTYNGDQMSSYNVNATVPKTLVRCLVEYRASVSEPALAAVLRDINDTPVSPELLPGAQHTEALIGRYELHDFFLYYYLKYGETRATLLALAEKAFGSAASDAAPILDTFFRRFVTQQFKRDASPDGPKVGTIALSPRGDWRCPSDLSPAVWQ